MLASAFMFRLLAAASLASVAGSVSATALQELPKGARPGECYSRTTSAPSYRTDRIPVPRPPLVSWRDVPAIFKTVDKQVLVTPGRVDRETIPAVMGSRERWVEHPGADRTVDTPPVYRWVERRVLITPAHLVWRSGSAAGGYGSEDGEGISVRPTGEVMCRVRVPARYEIRRVRVLVTPGRTCVVRGPSTRERIIEQVMLKPAHVVEHPIAPLYRTVTERVLVTPGRKERVETPQPPRYVDHRVQIAPGKTGWMRIACKAPVAPRYHPRPMPVYSPPAPRPRGGQCHTHVVCEDVPYAQPRPAEQLYGAPIQPAYRAPPPSGYGAVSPSN